MKTLKRIIRQDKDVFKIPKGVLNTIPVSSICVDVIFLSGNTKYSKCYIFTDFNYAVAS